MDLQDINLPDKAAAHPWDCTRQTAVALFLLFSDNSWFYNNLMGTQQKV